MIDLYKCKKGLEFLSLVAERWPETIRILISGGCMDMDSVTRAINAGQISRFIPKPFNPVILAYQLLEEFNGSAEPANQE
jgi:response regulator RpfG family c-di-GMP phosphodiesterase